MGFLDKYLEKEHKEAAADFEKGDDKQGRDDDDKIGKIHDILTRIDAHLHDIHEWMTPKEQVDEAKKVADEEQKKEDEPETRKEDEEEKDKE